MSNELISAIIGASAVVLAAIIKGVFAIMKNKDKGKGEKSSQSVRAGSNAIVAGDGAVQNVNIISDVSPSPHPQTADRKRKLLEVTEQITERANKILEENETILSALFRDNPDRRQIRNQMMDLFTIQQSRASFGEWKSFLENFAAIEGNTEVVEAARELTNLLEKLHSTLYSYSHSSEKRAQNLGLLERFTKKKIVVTTFDDESVTIQELQNIVDDYLEYLRELVERIGRINGYLQSVAH